MPDEITPEERALINEAIKAGRVQKIPRGQSGIQYDVMSYRESHNKTYSQFILGRKKAGDMTRKRIQHLLSQGMTVQQISEAMTLKPQYVRYHISKIKETEQLDGDVSSC